MDSLWAGCTRDLDSKISPAVQTDIQEPHKNSSMVFGGQFMVCHCVFDGKAKLCGGTDSFPAAMDNINEYESLSWTLNPYFILSYLCIYLILNLMYFLLSIATGISCCGGMCLFGLWHKNASNFVSVYWMHLAKLHLLWSGCLLFCPILSWSLQCLDSHILCLIVMNKPRDRSLKPLVYVHVSGKFV